MDKILLFDSKDLEQLMDMIDPCLYNLILSTLCNTYYAKGSFKYLPDYDMESLHEVYKELKKLTISPAPPDFTFPSYYVLYIHDKDKDSITELTFYKETCFNAKLYELNMINIKDILPEALYQELCNSIEYFKKNKKKLIHSFHIYSEGRLLKKQI